MHVSKCSIRGKPCETVLTYVVKPACTSTCRRLHEAKQSPSEYSVTEQGQRGYCPDGTGWYQVLVPKSLRGMLITYTGKLCSKSLQAVLDKGSILSARNSRPAPLTPVSPYPLETYMKAQCHLSLDEKQSLEIVACQLLCSLLLAYFGLSILYSLRIHI